MSKNIERRNVFKLGIGIAAASVLSGLGLSLGGAFARRKRVDSNYSKPIGNVDGVVASVGDSMPLYEVSQDETDVLGSDLRPIPAAVSICVKYTIVDADVFGDCETLTEYRDTHDGLESSLLDVIDGQFIAFPEVWCAQNGYCAQIGSEDALVNGDIREVTFARANNLAEIIDDATYDRNTGVVYVPEHVFSEDNTIQMQIVYAHSFANGVPAIKIDYDVSAEASSGVDAVADTCEVSLFAPDFELPIAPAGTDLLTEQIRVYLNGSASCLRDGQWVYDADTGSVIVFVSPFAVDTVHVDVVSLASKAFGLTSASMNYALSKIAYPNYSDSSRNFKEGISLYMPDTGFEPGDVITYMAPSAADVIYNVKHSPWLNSLYGYYIRESTEFYNVIYYNPTSESSAAMEIRDRWEYLLQNNRIRKVIKTIYTPAAPDRLTNESHWTVFSVDLYGNGMYTTDGNRLHGLTDTLEIYGDWHIRGSGDSLVTFKDLSEYSEYKWLVSRSAASKRLAEAVAAMTTRAMHDLPVAGAPSGLRNYVRMPLLCTHIGQSSAHTLDVGDFEVLREAGADSQYRAVKFQTNGYYNIIPAPVRLRVLDKKVSSDPEKSYVIFGLISAAFYAGSDWGWQAGSGIYKVHLVTKGKLTVKKETRGPAADTSKQFTFTVTFSGKNAPANQTFKLYSGQSKTIDEIPIGVSYTVTETADEQYSLSWEGGKRTGKITNGNEIVVTAVNTRKTGKLRVKKNVIDPEPADLTRKFHFVVTVTTDTGKHYKTFEFDLSQNDGWHEFEPIPSGYKYVVHENVPEGYSCEANDSEGNILVNKTSDGIVPNQSHGYLQLEKDVTE